MLARVTSVEDIFSHVKFRTEVTWVEFDELKEKFLVKSTDLAKGIQTENAFDYFVWAGGTFRKPRYPDQMHGMLKRDGFSGDVLHSAELVDFGPSLKGKKVLLVGDSHSAEDLALQALKMEAEHVVITSSARNGVASTMSTWPENRVESLKCLVSAVIHNGTGLLCSEVKWNT